MAAADDVVRVSLAKGEEWRVEVGGSQCTVLLTKGTAEVFGVELADGQKYRLHPHRSVAFFTWDGCDLVVEGPIAHEYKSGETNMNALVYLHQRLEARRSEAEAAQTQGPRVMLVGPTDAGKSTTCRTLCGYACRLDRSPTFVDLDCGQGELTPPGNVAAVPLSLKNLSVENGYVRTKPIVYSAGGPSPSQDVNVYKQALHKLSEAVEARTERDPHARASGIVVNTMGWVEGLGLQLVVDSILALRIDIVLVVGGERTNSMLQKALKRKTISPPRFFKRGRAEAAAAAAGAAGEAPAPVPAHRYVTQVLVPRSSGAIARSRAARQAARQSRFHRYFYGSPTRPLTPVSTTLSVVASGEPLPPAGTTTGAAETVMLVTVSGVSDTQMLRPSGAQSTLSDVIVESVGLVPGVDKLLNQVVAVYSADSEHQVPSQPVRGFLHITGVDMENSRLTVTAPNGGALPGRILALGSGLQFIDGR